MSPLWRGGEILVYLCPLSSSARFVSVRSLCLSCLRLNMWRWPNAGLMLAHRLRRWASICQHFHAECRPASQTAGQQHEVGLLTTVEWILASTGDAGQTFNRHCVSVCLHCQTRSPANTRCWTSAGFMLCQRCRWWARIGPALGQRLLFARSVDRPHLCFAHHLVWRY